MRSAIKRLGWVFGVSTALVGAMLSVHGCGSDEESTGSPGGSAGSDAGGDVSQGGEAGSSGSAGSGGVIGDSGADIEVKPNCELVGASCASHSDCCSANCDPDTNVCTNPTTPCKVAGEGCAAATECCTTVCTGGLCGEDVCISDNEPCVTGDLCCSGKCEAREPGGAGGAGDAGSVCVPLNTECFTVGNECDGHDECCSSYCENGRCEGNPSFCTQTGDACTTDDQCCAGICVIESSATVGVCTMPSAPGATGCSVAGEVCGDGAEGADGGLPTCGGKCCSRSCAPYGPTGVLICQPPSGCRPTGETCRDDGDCCGSEGMPGAGDKGFVTCSKAPGEPVGQCDNGGACRGAGAVCKLATSSCNAENDCCAGNVNQDPTACQQDLLGIPRCTGVGDCADAGPFEGKECATSADCCGLPCLPNADPNGPAFICGTSCVPAGSACSTSADCCSGLPCVAPPGSTQGICGYTPPPDGGVPDSGVPDGAVPDVDVPDGPDCAFYGQECVESADCCNDVPCTNGRCIQPVY
jgi:hypothetical protein